MTLTIKPNFISDALILIDYIPSPTLPPFTYVNKAKFNPFLISPHFRFSLLTDMSVRRSGFGEKVSFKRWQQGSEQNIV